MGSELPRRLGVPAAPILELSELRSELAEQQQPERVLRSTIRRYRAQRARRGGGQIADRRTTLGGSGPAIHRSGADRELRSSGHDRPCLSPRGELRIQRGIRCAPRPAVGALATASLRLQAPAGHRGRAAVTSDGDTRFAREHRGRLKAGRHAGPPRGPQIARTRCARAGRNGCARSGVVEPDVAWVSVVARRVCIVARGACVPRATAAICTPRLLGQRGPLAGVDQPHPRVGWGPNSAPSNPHAGLGSLAHR